MEVNRINRSFLGLPNATDDVVPNTRCDLYAYSMWGSAGKGPEVLTQRLNRLAARAPDSDPYGDQNIFLGEFGAPREHLGHG